MYRKLGNYQTKQQQNVKKSTGCHGQNERMEEISGLDKLTLCKILLWFTFVSVQEIGWKNTYAAIVCCRSKQYEEGKYVEGKG